jgi:carbonic anhydrase
MDNAAGTKPVTNYVPSAGKIVNLVDTWKYVPAGASDGTFTRPDGVYNLIQWHIHSLSEHRINKTAFAAEIHCMYINSHLSCPCQS